MKTLRRLPSLDFLRGFEAAGRQLSFTRAAEELFVTQSALSRQVQALEEALGVPLFVRRHRALALTPAGAAFHRDVTAALGALAAAARRRARRRSARPGLTLSTTVSFASLWVIPRLAAFRARHPDVEVYVSADDRLIDLGRGDVDVAVRYWPTRRRPRRGCASSASGCCRSSARSSCAAASTPLAKPADLARHVLLHLDDPDGRTPWLEWSVWLACERAAGTEARRVAALQALRPGDPGRRRRPGRGARTHSADRRASARRAARRAVSQALRIGARLLRGRRARMRRERADVAAFVDWLRDEAATRARRSGAAPPSKRRRAECGRQSPRR